MLNQRKNTIIRVFSIEKGPSKIELKRKYMGLIRKANGQLQRMYIFHLRIK